MDYIISGKETEEACQSKFQETYCSKDEDKMEGWNCTCIFCMHDDIHAEVMKSLGETLIPRTKYDRSQNEALLRKIE